MDSSDFYSYGYDQVSVSPVRHVNYDDSEFNLAQNNLRDPYTKNLHEKYRIRNDYNDYHKNVPFYSDAGIQKRYERQQIKENIEDILNPYSRNPHVHDNVKDIIAVAGNDIKQLEELSYREKCKECRIKKKCDTCSRSKHGWMEEGFETNMILILMVVILSAFCIIQYINTQYINSTLLGMINIQRNITPNSSINNSQPDKDSSPYVEND
jgi:hypothetical protein